MSLPAFERRRGPAARVCGSRRVSERRLHHAESGAFRQAMRALSTGVAIVACGEGESRHGCTVTAFASLSLTPPTLYICLARTSTTLAALREVRGLLRQSARRPARGAGASVQRPRRRSRRPALRGRELGDARDRRADPRRRGRRLRLPGRGGDRAAFPRHRARRRGEPPRGRERACARPRARRVLRRTLIEAYPSAIAWKNEPVTRPRRDPAGAGGAP